jgi:hypothetical protein
MDIGGCWCGGLDFPYPSQDVRSKEWEGVEDGVKLRRHPSYESTNRRRESQSPHFH